MKTGKNQNKFLLFLKNNAFYIVLTLCVVAIALTITLVALTDNTGTDPLMPSIDIPDDGQQAELPGDTIPVDAPGDITDPALPGDDQPVSGQILFIVPVDGYVIQDYTNTVSYNATLGVFSSHKAIDFGAEEGASVYAVYDGVVTAVTNSVVEGVSVTIDHGKGLITVYNSLADGDGVFVGKRVSKGDVIGTVSTSNRREYKDGAHLHFEVLEDGVNIDPEKYLVLDEK